MAVPKAPTNLTVVRSDDRTAVFLKWDSVTEDIDDASTTVTSYRVYSTDSSNGLHYYEAAIITPATGVDTQYTVLYDLPDSAVVLPINPDIVYTFKVMAVNSAGVSEFSSEVADY